jgi:ligand-binding sensor domain-containing protein
LKLTGKIALIFLFLIHVNSFSQEPSIKKYDLTNGLPSNECYKVIQDKKGYIWVASDKGLSRYNGYNFQNFTKKDGLPDNGIIQLFEDLKGRIWTIGLNSRVAYFENETFYPIKELNVFLEKNVKKAQIFSVYVNDKDELHIGFNNIYPSLLTYSLASHKITKKNAQNNTFCILTDNHNNFVYNIPYILTSNLDQLKIHLTIQPENSKKTVVDLITHNNPNRISYLKLNEDSVLVSMGRELYLIHGNTIENVLKFNTSILFLYKDSGNRIWVLVQNNGAYILETTSLFNGELKHVFKNYSFSSIFEDKEHTFWLSSLKGGLYQIPDFDIIHYSIQEKGDKTKLNVVTKFNNSIYIGGVSNHIYSYTKETNFKKAFDLPDTSVEISDMLAQKKHLIIAGPISYLATINANGPLIRKLKNRDPKWTLYLKYINASTPNSDTILVGGSIGYVKMNTNTLEKISYDIMPPKTINNIYADSGSKNIYLACLDGLYYIPDRYLPSVSMKDKVFDGIRNHFLSFLQYTEEKNRLYISAQFGKSYYIRDNYLSFSKVPDKLLDTRINFITKKGNTFIMSGEERGIIFWDGKKSWNIDVSEGLASNVCKKALVDKQGNIWAATNKGISKIETKADGSFEINNLTTHEGLSGDDVYNFSIIDDEIWIPTENGVTKFNTDIWIKNNILPPVYITGIAVDDSVYTLNSFSEIPYQHNYIKINYNGLSYKSNGDLVYEYRLNGLDSSWKKTRNIQVDFTRLGAGEYMFEVQAIKNNHLKSAQAAAFKFVIYPPWYKTWWFLSLSILATVSIIYLFFWIRFKRLKAREEEKTKLVTLVTETEIKALRAQTNPHFIFNALNSISLFVLKNDSDQAQFYLMRFAQLMRDVLENSEHDVIALGKEFSILKTYMELEVLRFSGKYKFDIAIPEALLSAKIIIPPLLLQPIIENAIWHGLMPLEERGGLLLLKAKKEGDTVIITVEDNGIGRKRSAELKVGKSSHKTSKGIFMTKNRIDLYNNKHTEKIKTVTTDLIDDNQNPIGTRVEIIIENINQ